MPLTISRCQGDGLFYKSGTLLRFLATVFLLLGFSFPVLSSASNDFVARSDLELSISDFLFRCSLLEREKLPYYYSESAKRSAIRTTASCALRAMQSPGIPNSESSTATKLLCFVSDEAPQIFCDPALNILLEDLLFGLGGNLLHPENHGNSAGRSKAISKAIPDLVLVRGMSIRQFNNVLTNGYIGRTLADAYYPLTSDTVLRVCREMRCLEYVPTYVYTELFESIEALKTEAMNQLNFPVFLLLSTEALDRDDFHLSDGWIHGRFTVDGSAIPNEVIAFLQGRLRKVGINGAPVHWRNEVVFKNPIPSSLIKGIIVSERHVGCRQKLCV